jgi:signal transduction histidine kinase
MAETVAQRAALLLDNARLFDATKRAVQTRDEMLGVVAHDLRNPLAAIAALAAVVRRNGTDREAGDDIDHAVNRMDRLIQDLIDVTRIEAGHRLSLGLERIDAAAVISDTLKAQTPLASSTALELRLDVAPDLPDIWADRQRLLQVFENLVGNAIKFTKPSGKITLTAAAREDEVLFSVADTGSGIAGYHLPRVFDRFWQAPQDKRPGAGLGLAIVKGIVDAHGGRIWVQSTPGQGSTFFFTIPMAASRATPSRRATALHGA